MSLRCLIIWSINWKRSIRELCDQPHTEMMPWWCFLKKEQAIKPHFHQNGSVQLSTVPFFGVCFCCRKLWMVPLKTEQCLARFAIHDVGSQLELNCTIMDRLDPHQLPDWLTESPILFIFLAVFLLVMCSLFSNTAYPLCVINSNMLTRGNRKCWMFPIISFIVLTISSSGYTVLCFYGITLLKYLV